MNRKCSNLPFPSRAAVAAVIFFALQGAVASLASTTGGRIPAGFYPIEPPIFGDLTIVGASDDGSFAAGIVVTPAARQMLIWNPVTGSQLIPLPSNLSLFDVTAVSADGTTVVGQVRERGPFAPRQAFRWTITGGFETLGTLSSDSFDRGFSSGVNSDGSIVVGYSETPNGRRAFRWSQASGMVNLGVRGNGNPLYPPDSAAADLSEDGSVIAGHTTVGGKWYAQFGRWTESRGWEVLGSLPPDGQGNASATSMTADGSVLVGSNQGNGFEGVIWTEDNGLRPLPRPPGSNLYTARLISDDGSFITGGYSNTLGISAPAAWLKRGSTYQFEPLNDLVQQLGLDLGGWTISNVWSISSDGRVLAGEARDEFGQRRGYVAVLPVPEPCTLALIVIAAAQAILSLHRKNRQFS